MTDAAQQPGADIFVAEITAVGSAPIGGFIPHGFKEKMLDPLTLGLVDNPMGRIGTTTVTPLVTLSGDALAVGDLVPARLRGWTQAKTATGPDKYARVVYETVGNGSQNDPVCCCCGSTSGPPGTTITGTTGTGGGTTVGGTVNTQVGGVIGPPVGITSMVATTDLSGITPSVSGVSPSIGARPCPSGTRPVTLGDGTQACASVGDLQNLLDFGQASLRGAPLSGPALPTRSLSTGFLGQRSPAFKGGSAALSALRLDTGTNGFVPVWNDTTKTFVPTDPATFGGSLVVASGDVSAQTMTQTLYTHAVGAVNAVFRAGAYIDRTTSGALDHVNMTINYTDWNSVSQTITTGDITTVTTVYIEDFQFRAKAGTNITAVATVTAGAPTFDASSTVEKLR